MKNKEKKPLLQRTPAEKKLRLLCNITLISLTVHYFMLTGQTFIPLIIGIGLILRFLSNRDMEVGTRSIVYSGMCAMLLAAFNFKIIGRERFFHLTPGTLALPFLLFYCNFTLFSKLNKTTAAVCGATLGGAVFALGDYNPAKNLAALQFLHKNLTWIYLAQCALTLSCLSCLGSYRLQQRLVKAPSGRRSTKILRLLPLILILGCLVLSQPVTTHALPAMKKLSLLLSQSASQQLSNSSQQKTFEDNSDISQPMQNPQGGMATIMMRITGETPPPSYLRFMTYEHYEGTGNWTTSLKDTRKLDSEDNQVEEGKLIVRDRFIVNPRTHILQTRDKQTEVSNTIFPSSSLSTKRMPLSYDTFLIDAIADEIATQTDGSLIPKKLSADAGITLLRSEKKELAHQVGQEEYLQQCRIQIPVIDLTFLREKSVQISLNPGDSAQVTMKKIQDWFEQNYTYSLDFSAYEQSSSPSFIKNFLSQDNRYQDKNDRKGHCELFATSAVLLLRSQNIPARYVTGIMVHEQVPDEDYYIARSRDLHAWCEVYDISTQQWVPFDPTPSDMNQVLPKFPMDSWDKFMESISFEIQKFTGMLQEGHIAASVAGIWFGLVDAFTEFWKKSLNFRIATILFCLMIFYFIWRRIKGKKYKSQQQQTQYEISLLLQQLSSQYPEANLQNLPIRDICLFLQEKRPELAIKLQKCNERYQEIRFGSAIASDTDSKNIAQELQHIRISLKTLPQTSSAS